ncbi:ANKRD50 [Symbiodinium sp. CCMP2592]|nr:ANKRD50 [Symbiodinium sp. CCMP2592]
MPRSKTKAKPEEAPWRQRGDDYSQYGGKWSLWPGSWRSTGSPNAKPRDKPFPSYDRQWTEEQYIRVIHEQPTEAKDTKEAALAQRVQAAVNQLRKAEARVAKITSDQKTKAERFVEYEKKMMAAFVEERRKYTEHQERMATGLIEAQRQVVEAKEALAQTVEGVAGVKAMEVQSGEMDEWTAMIHRHTAQSSREPIDPGLMEVLRAYKAGHLPVFPGVAPTPSAPPPMGQQVAPCAPSAPGQAAASREKPAVSEPLGDKEPSVEHAVPTYGAVSPGAAQRAAPYPTTSPTALRPHVETPTPVPASASLPQAPAVTGQGEHPRTPNRVGIKEATMQPPAKPEVAGASLQQKLEERREVERGNALQPFRGGMPSTPAPSTERKDQTEAQDQHQGSTEEPTKTSFIDDDLDGPTARVRCSFRILLSQMQLVEATPYRQVWSALLSLLRLAAGGFGLLGLEAWSTSTRRSLLARGYPVLGLYRGAFSSAACFDTSLQCEVPTLCAASMSPAKRAKETHRWLWGVHHGIGSGCVHAVARTAWGIFALLLASLWLRQVIPRGVRPRRLARLLFTGTYKRVLLGFACATPRMEPVLAWKPLCRRVKSGGDRPPGSRFLWYTMFCLWSLPVQIWAAPTGLSRTLEAVEGLIALAPQCAEDVRWFDDPQFADLGHSCSFPLPVAEGSLRSVDHQSWIGVTVHAPLSQPQHFALWCPGEQGPRDFSTQVLEVIQRDRPGYHVAVPVYPQRHAGYAALILAAPEDDRRGQTSVILDLSHVGGHYYAATLPATIRVESFLDSIRVQTSVSNLELCLWMPPFQGPVASQATLNLGHGDVLTVLWEGVRPLRPVAIDDVLRAPSVRGRIQHMPVASQDPGFLVVCQDELFALPLRHLQGSNLKTNVCRALRCDAASLTLYSVTLHSGSAHQGEHCDTVLVVQDRSQQAVCGEACPLLCDARQMGLGVCVWPNAPEHVTGQDVLDFLGIEPSHRITVSSGYGPAPADATYKIRSVQILESCHQPCPSGHTDLRAAAGPTLLQRLYQGAAQEEHLPGQGPQDQTDSETSEGAPQPHHDLQPPGDHSDHSDEGGFDATFMVLRLEYTPIELHVHLPTGVGVQEALDIIATDMDPAVSDVFSTLLPVRPQLATSWGSVLALPPWAADEAIIVLDIRQYDDRFYPAPVPRLFTRAHVLRVAALPEDPTFRVFAFGATVPLADTDEAEVIVGGSIAIVPAGRSPSRRGRLTHMLAHPEAWEARAFLPRGPGGDRSPYPCLVFEEGHRMHVLDNPPGLHIEALAMRYGYQPHMTTAQVTRPRVADMSFNGYHCKGVGLVSGDMTSVRIPPARLRPGLFLSVVDCRPILQGDCDALLRDVVILPPQAGLVFEAEVAWPCIECECTLAPRLQWAKLGVDLFRHPLSFPLKNLMPTQCRLRPGQHLSAPTESHTHPVAGEQQMLHTWEARQQGPGAPPPVFTVDRPDTGPQVAQPGTPFTAVFLVFVQDYQPELVEVELFAPCTFDIAMATVSRSRGRRAKSDFPILAPAYPQTLSGIGLLLALPDWPLDGVPILVDCTQVDGRIFSVVVSPVMDRSSLLSLAEVPLAQPLRVFLGDMPWPLEHRQPVRLQEGDVVTVVHVEHEVMVLTNLPDMLLSAQGWRTADAIPGEFSQSLRVLTEVEPFRAQADPYRRQLWTQDIADHFGVAPQRLCLRPPVPNILNHADRGHLTLQVLVALLRPALGPVPDLCVLDLRALCQGVVWQHTVDGFFQQAEFMRRFARWIPEQHRLIFGCADGQVDSELDRVPAIPGMLFTAIIQPFPRPRQILKAHQRPEERPREGLTSTRTLLMSQSQKGTALAEARGPPPLSSHWDVAFGAQQTRPDPLSHGVIDSVLKFDAFQVHGEEWAFQTWTLLEVLADHLSTQRPLTECGALELQSIIPGPYGPATGATLASDWLDCDLSSLTRDYKIPEHLRFAFDNLPVWTRDTELAGIAQIAVYTDGSAPGQPGEAQTPAAWAFSVWAETHTRSYFVGAAAHSAVPADTPFFLGEARDDAVTGELLALAWALCWALEFGPALAVPLVFRFDATSVGYGSFATAQQVSYPVADDSLSLPAFVGTLRQTLDYYDRCLPTWPAEWRRHSLAAWGWLAHPGATDLPCLPAFEAEAARLQTLDLPGKYPDQGLRQVQQPESEVTYLFRLMTYNILTMFDPGAPQGRRLRTESNGLRVMGKRQLVKQQLLEQQVWITGFQETRLPNTGMLPDADFYMYSAAANDRGQGGCAVWINKTCAYATERGRELKVAPDHVTVLGSSHRHLHLLVEAPRLCLQVLVAHCPRVSTSGAEAPKEFWDGHVSALSRHANHASTVVLADANGRLGEVVTGSVGSIGAEPEDLEGTAFHDFLLQIASFLPATTEVHSGTHHTWFGPDPSVSHRIDYVAVPNTWHDKVLSSWLWSSFEALQARQDHVPACLEVGFVKSDYLQPATLDLVSRRRALREYLEAEEVERNRHWLSEIDFSIAQAVAMLRDTTRAIKAAVMRDRITYLDSLRDEVALQDSRNPKALYSAVRKAFPAARSSRRTSFRPLPAVRLEDGRLASDRETCLARWRDFFGSQEAAEPVTPSMYASRFACPDIPVLPEGPLFCIHDVPPLSSLERHVLRAKPGKACGADGITSELLQLAPAAVARSLYPVCLKTTLGVREPCEWRGGTLLSLAKKAATALECSGYRSILVESVAAKLHHRNLRDLLLPSLASYCDELQAGQLQGIGVDTVGLAVRTYQHWALSAGQVCALTYFDVKSAFYRVIRQALVPTGPTLDDARLLRLLSDLAIPSGALPELMRHLHGLCILQDAKVGGFLQAQVSDLFRGSWFRLDKDGVAMLTARGSRPGDPLADVLFAFTFGAYVRAVKTALTQRGLSTPVPQVSSPPPWHTWEPVHTLGLPAWADDYTHLQSAQRPPELIDRVVRATSLVVEQATSLGMTLAFARDKTATLLASNCPRTDSPHILHDDKDGTYMLIRDDIACVTHQLPVIDAYRMMRPLRGRLFSDVRVPLTLRRTFLHSLVLSRFTFASSTLDLHAAQHRRTWCRHYVLLWRGLLRWKDRDDSPHSYAVLQAANAPSPLLALAQTRASFLGRLLQKGPGALLHLLHAHWRQAPLKSWLGAFVLDLKAVAVYVNAAADLLRMSCPVTALLEAVQDSPSWWKARVKQAIQRFCEDLANWRPCRTAPGQTQSTTADRPYVCDECGDRFVLRKHLGVHLARRHGRLSPSRHYALGPQCLACMKHYHCVRRVQAHLKHSPSCLARLLHVFPPLSVAQITEVESADVKIQKQVRGGHWGAYVAALPVQQALGPRPPIYTEITGGDGSEDIDLARLARLFRPAPGTVQWVMDHIAQASVEGARDSAQDFWLQRPLPFFNQHKFFLLIEVLSSTPQVFTKWTGWIESKLRQLVKHLEQIPSVQVRPWPNHIPFQDPDWKHALSIFMGLTLEKTGGRQGQAVDLRKTVTHFVEIINSWPDKSQHSGQCEMRAFASESESKQRSPATSEQQSVGDAALKRQLDPGDGLPPPCRQKLSQEHENSDDSPGTAMDVQVLILPFSPASKRQQKELYQAARSGGLDEVETLLQLPRDPDAAVDAFGRTALMHASERGHIGVVELLLEARAQVDLCNNYGGAALTDAASYGRYCVVQLLMEAGAQKDLRNNRGRTALMDAAINGHAQVVQLLLESGVDKDLCDDLGLTARMMAKARQHDEVQRLLETEGAADQQENEVKNGDTNIGPLTIRIGFGGL